MKRFFNKKSAELEQKAPRITANTMADYREQVINSGRRFKYPLQYSRHKLVINTVIISLLAVILASLYIWWQLYLVQNTNDFMYRITKIIPLPIAKIDNRRVAYGDYLLAYRSSIHYSRQKEKLDEKTEEGKSRIEDYKKRSLDGAVANTYAKKKAQELNLSVSQQELEDYIKEQRQSSNGEVSQEAFDASGMEFFGLTPAEARGQMEMVLLKNKVMFAMDKEALELAQTVLAMSKTLSFKELVDNLNDQQKKQVSVGYSGWVSNFNQDGGLTTIAKTLEKGQVAAQLVESSLGEGYFIVKLVDKNNEQVNYEYININLLEFNRQLGLLKQNKNNFKQYIKI